MTEYFVYILHSACKDKYYIGHTQDLQTRLTEHNSGQTKSIKSGIPWRLVFQVSFPSRGEAMKYKNHLKRMKSRKYLEALIQSG